MSRAGLYASAAAVAAVVSIVAATARLDAGDTAQALDGANLFRAKGCAACHAGPDTAGVTGVAPSLARAPEWAGERIEGMSAEEYLAQSMREPAAFISPAWSGASGPTTNMPLLQLSHDEIDALVEYLLQRQP